MINAKSRKLVDQVMGELWETFWFYHNRLPGIWNALEGFGIESEDELEKVSFSKLSEIVDHLEDLHPFSDFVEQVNWPPSLKFFSILKKK